MHEVCVIFYYYVIVIGTMAARKMRGLREPKDISIETYTNVTEDTSPLLSGQGTSKSQSSSTANSEETSCTNSTYVASSGSGETAGATACTLPDQISFISGNPFVEVTKGILHLFKEE